MIKYDMACIDFDNYLKFAQIISYLSSNRCSELDYE